MAELVRVLPSKECPLGTPQEPELRLVTVAGTEIILVRLDDGQVVALAAHCPHQGTPLLDASFFDGRLRCPYHLYLYDPHTGENVVPFRDARPENLWKLKPGYLATYPAEERNGWIWVAPTPHPPPSSYDPERERRPVGSRRSGSDDVPTGARTNPIADAGDPPVEHPTKTVRLGVGVTFELRLPVTPLPGHMWRAEVVDGPLTILEERFDPTDPPRHRVRLIATEPGSATVRCSFARPWDAAVAESRTYVVRVT